MVDVLKKGTARTIEVYDFDCKTCGSELRAKYNEFKSEGDMREQWYTIKCPVCSAQITIENIHVYKNVIKVPLQ
jgi:transcription elongation factor Elf1